MVETKMSETIFLDPVEPEEQTIHFTLRDTTGKQLSVGIYLRTALEGVGF